MILMLFLIVMGMTILIKALVKMDHSNSSKRYLYLIVAVIGFSLVTFSTIIIAFNVIQRLRP